MASESGELDSKAMYNLGLKYLNGDGVPQDKDKGMELVQRASDSGDIDAMD